MAPTDTKSRLKKLIQVRDMIASKLARFEKAISTLPVANDLIHLNQRIEAILPINKEFDANQQEIELLDPNWD